MLMMGIFANSIVLHMLMMEYILKQNYSTYVNDGYILKLYCSTYGNDGIYSQAILLYIC